MRLDILWRLKDNGLVRDTILYTLTDAIGKAIGFIVLPFLSYYLSPEDMGLATNYSVLTSITVLLAGAAMVNALPYFFYEQNAKQRQSFISNLILLCFAISFFLLFILLFLHNAVINYLKLDLKVILLAIPVTILTLIQNANLVLCRLEEKPKLFAFYQISYIVLHVVMMVLLVIIFKLGGYGRIYADIITCVLMGVVHLFRLFKLGYIDFKIDFKYIKDLLKFGVPLLPHSLSFWIKGGADKVIITNLCGLTQNGLYSMALTMNSIYNLLSNSLMNAYVPSLQKRLVEVNPENLEEEKRKVIKQCYLIIFVFLLIAILSVFAAWIFLYYIVDPRYKESFKFVPLLILGQWIYCIYNLSIQYIYKEKKTLVLGIITFIGSIIQIGFTWLFVRLFGIIGVAYSAVMGSIIISLGIFIYSNKVYPMPWFYWVKKRGAQSRQYTK